MLIFRVLLRGEQLGFLACFMLLPSFLFVPLGPLSIAANTIAPTDDAVITSIRQMADWQISALGAGQDESWKTATLFDGLIALYQVSGDSQYLTRALSWGNANNWTLASPQLDPDNQNAGQVFLEMYLLQGSSKDSELTPTQNVMDEVMAGGGSGQQVWWWADSLFMAPPTFARLGYATSNANYYSFMDTWYWESANYLIDPASNLFWRDASFFGKTCQNGGKMFWSRGNAWVMAGLVRILEFLPQNDPDRPKFVSLLQNMAVALAPLQRPNGYWSSCLTDTTDYPEPETSGTAGFVYAMAWGINNGLLDAATYTPIVQKGWSALVNAIQPNGALGWVQPPGTQPAASTANDTFPYGVGLALLAGSEVAKMTQPLITLTPFSAPAGTTVTVFGSNFAAGDTTCIITSTTPNLVLSPQCSVSDGSLTGTFDIGSVANGLYTITVAGNIGDSATANVNVSTATLVTMTASISVTSSTITTTTGSVSTNSTFSTATRSTTFATTNSSVVTGTTSISTTVTALTAETSTSTTSTTVTSSLIATGATSATTSLLSTYTASSTLPTTTLPPTVTETTSTTTTTTVSIPRTTTYTSILSTSVTTTTITSTTITTITEITTSTLQGG